MTMRKELAEAADLLIGEWRAGGAGPSDLRDDDVPEEVARLLDGSGADAESLFGSRVEELYPWAENPVLLRLGAGNFGEDTVETTVGYYEPASAVRLVVEEWHEYGVLPPAFTEDDWPVSWIGNTSGGWGLRVGCHAIPFGELEMIAHEAGWLDAGIPLRRTTAAAHLAAFMDRPPNSDLF